MADYAETTLFIKGSKKAVAGFLNRGLRARKSDRRVTLRMTGGEIVELLNGLEKPLQMGSYLPRPKTFDIWDTTNKMYDLYYWYVHGCVRHFEHRWMDERVDEIEEFMEAHPSDFQKVPQEKDPLFSNPDKDEIIMVLPEEYFRNCAIAIVAIIVILTVTLIVTEKRRLRRLEA